MTHLTDCFLLEYLNMHWSETPSFFIAPKKEECTFFPPFVNLTVTVDASSLGAVASVAG